MDTGKKAGKVVTFYSYKGGVGRTMSMVNVAALMVKQNKKVLLIDWDLEAPGLHTFFPGKISTEEIGLVDFIADSITFCKGNDEFEDYQWHDYFEAEVHKHIHKVITDNHEIIVDIIKAGKFDDDYTHRLNGIDWLGFYKRSPYFFSYFSQYLESHYDYIFIDSRTGLSDTGGLCTMLMPQILVLVFALNDQNINGVIDVAKQSLEYRFASSDYRDLNILPLPSRIDDQNSTELQKWISKYSLKFEELFKESYLLDECHLLNYFNKAMIPYKPEHAYGERIPVLFESIENSLFITYHYDQFSKLIIENIPCWEILSAAQIEQNLKLANEHFKKGLELYYQQKYVESVKEYEKVANLVPNEPSTYGNLGLSLVKIAGSKEGQEGEILYYEAFENFRKAIELDPEDYQTYSNWGTSLGNLARIKDGEEVEILLSQAFDMFQKATELNPEHHLTYLNWGFDLSTYASIKDVSIAEHFYKEAFVKYNRATELEPDYYLSYVNWGIALSNFAGNKDEAEADHLYYEALAKFQRATELKPEDYITHLNWGNTLVRFAILKSDNEKEILFNEAIQIIEKAIKLNSNDYQPYRIWGYALGHLAEIRKEKDGDELYIQSFNKLQKATEIKIDDYLSFSYWGLFLAKQADNKKGDEKELLYIEASEKLQKVNEIRIDYYDNYTNLSNVFIELAKLKSGQNRNIFLKQAKEKALIAYDKLGQGYNLACCHALLNDKTEALKYLKLSLEHKEVTVDLVLIDEDWKEFWDDEGFKEIMAMIQ